MQLSIPYIDIIIFAVIAVFLIYRLKNILGEKNGFDPSEENSEDTKISKPSNVLEFNKKKTTALDQKINDLKRIKKNFTTENFLNGAKIFFSMIIKSFVDGDMSNVKDYVRPDIIKNFQNAIKERKSDNETLIIDIKNVDNISIKDLKIDKTKIVIQVLFETTQIKALKDKNNKLIDGDLKSTIKVKDLWKFEQEINTNQENWILTETAIA